MIINIFCIILLIIIYVFLTFYCLYGIYDNEDAIERKYIILFIGIMFGIILGSVSLAIDIHDKLWNKC